MGIHFNKKLHQLILRNNVDELLGGLFRPNGEQVPSQGFWRDLGRHQFAIKSIALGR